MNNKAKVKLLLVIPSITSLLKELNDKVVKFLNTCRLGNEDIRRIAIRNINDRIAGLLLVFKEHYNYFQNNLYETIYEDTKLRNETELQDADDALNRFLLAGFVTSIHFSIDTLFRHILRNLDFEIGRKTYGKLVEKMIKELPDSFKKIDKDDKNSDAFFVLTHVRDSQHNGGYHSSFVEPKYTFKGFDNKEINFEFINGEQLVIIWKDIIRVIDIIFDMLLTLFDDSSIKKFASMLYIFNSSTNN